MKRLLVAAAVLCTGCAKTESADADTAAQAVAASSPAPGVRPGMAVGDAEKILGKTRSVAQSEIESREYIQFENQPVWITVRLGEESKLLSLAIDDR